MEEATKRGLIQKLTMMRDTSSHTPNHMSPGTGRQTFYPNAQLPPAQFYSPVPSAHHLGQRPPSTQTQPAIPTIVTPSTQNSTIYSPNSFNAQKNTIYSPNSFSTQNTTIYSPHANASHQSTPSPPQSRRPTLQSPFQPPQRSLLPGLIQSPSVGDSSQHAHHSTAALLQRHYPQVHSSHVRRSCGSSQARHHPYGSTPNRPSHDMPQAISRGTSQAQPRSGISTLPCLHSQCPESSLPHNGVSTLPCAPTLSRSPQGVQQPHCGDVSHLLSTNKPTASQPLPHGPSQSRFPSGAPQYPLSSQGSSSNSLILPQPGFQGPSRPHSRSMSQNSLPVNSMSPSPPADKLQPLSSHNTRQSYARDTPQTPQPKLPPTPPRVWADWLEPVTEFTPQLQAQAYGEDSVENQKALLGKVQQRSLSKLRPHEFLEYLSIDYNLLFKPKKAKVYDFYIMQALLFNKDFVLLVSSRRQKSPRLEPPQSIWHAYNLLEYRSHAEIELHIHTTLNRVTNLTPDELVLCAGYERHDSAINAVSDNGNLEHGWSTTLCYEVKLSHSMPKLHNHSVDFMVHSIHQKDVKDIKNMDPVWKAKILEIFKTRKENEDALQYMEKTWH